MKRVVRFTDVNEIEEFVNCARKVKQEVIASKQNFSYQVDAASLLGMMLLLGEKITIEFVDTTDEFNGVLSKYAVK